MRDLTGLRILRYLQNGANHMTFTELREKHPMFKFMEIFPDFQRTETGCVLHLKYLFSISGIDGLFTPTWEIPCKTELSQKPGSKRLDSPLEDDLSLIHI